MASNDVTVQKEKRNVFTWTTGYPPELNSRSGKLPELALSVEPNAGKRPGCSL
jgi:hypothetical protein